MSRRKPKDENTMPGHTEAVALLEQRHDTFATLEDRLAYERHLRNTVPAMRSTAVQGLVDDPSGRVAEAVFGQVFAAVWIRRQDINTERRLAAARAEAGTAMRLARAAYLAEVEADKE